MKKFELKPKAKESLTAIDAAIAQQTNAMKQQYEAYKKTVDALNAQKMMLLSSIIEEKEIPLDSKIILTPDYDLQEVTDDEFNALSKKDDSLNLEVQTKEDGSPGAKPQKKK